VLWCSAARLRLIKLGNQRQECDLATPAIAILEAQLPDGGAHTYPVRSQQLSIGRAEDNDVILDDPRVSRHHARLDFSGSTATLIDLGSTNGTWVQGHLIPPRTPVPLNLGTPFQLSEFRFRLLDPSAAVETFLGGRVRLATSPRPGLLAFLGDETLKFPLDKPDMSLGRAAGNDIVLPSPLVSRHHARIHREGDRYVIADVGSQNGLFLDNRRIAHHVLHDGDTIYIGGPSVALQFRLDMGFIPTAPSTASEPAAIDLKNRDRLTIGRAQGNDVVLDHPQVSRHHALIERAGARYRIKDLNSTNGVYVSGRRIKGEAWLEEGAEISIGGNRLVFRADSLQGFSGEGLHLDAIRLRKWVSKDKNLLQDITLSIHPHEFVALVGTSGSGKSTLIDAINGFRPATHGKVLVNGVDLYDHFDLFRNDIGYVPQKDIVHQQLTAYDALDYAARLRMPTDATADDRHRRIMEVLDELDLTDQRDLLISKLSGGQLKRVSIGVELLTKPRLFFLDEPTSGLDPAAELEMMRLLRKLADQGRTILLATHVTKNVMMCDRVIFLARGGFVAFYGPPEGALHYFDQFRTPAQRRSREIEFDDIYTMLSDEKLGTPEDWDTRYRNSEHYRANVSSEAHQQLPPDRVAAQSTAALAVRKTRGNAGFLRQFFLLLERNLKIIMQDRFGMALMLALAPAIGLMDFIWGTDLFDTVQGDATKIITMLFMTALITILVGAMASVREILKEADIYRRERAINLKLSSYVFSKICLGVVLSTYQAVVHQCCGTQSECCPPVGNRSSGASVPVRWRSSAPRPDPWRPAYQLRCLHPVGIRSLAQSIGNR